MTWLWTDYGAALQGIAYFGRFCGNGARRFFLTLGKGMGMGMEEIDHGSARKSTEGEGGAGGVLALGWVSDEELVAVYLNGCSRARNTNDPKIYRPLGVAAVRDRVEAPLLAEIETLKAKVDAFESAQYIRQVRSERDTLKARVAELERNLNICNESERMLEGEKESAFAQLTTEQRRVEDLRAELEAASRRVAELEANVKALSKIDENGLSTLSELVVLHMQLTAMTKAAEEIERVCGLHNKRIHDQESEIADLRAELEAVKAERDQWKRNADAVEAVKDMAIKADLDDVKKHRDRLLIGWQKSHIAEIEVKKLNEELAKVKAERDALRQPVGVPKGVPSVVELREIGIDAYLSHSTSKRENAGCMVDPMQAATIAVRARVEAPLLAEIRHLQNKLAILHPGETVEGVVMERDSYRIHLERAQQDLATVKADAISNG